MEAALPKDRLIFPDNFIWGTSTAGHQVEGGNAFSDWWAWEQKGLIADGTVSGRAMDYWNRHEEDHALMAKLAYKGFRLGIEWSRVEPQKGHFDGDVIEHYRCILQSLRNHGFAVCLTLHHWVIPRWVADQNDWLNPDTVRQFLRYVNVVVKALGAFPDYWVTLNEPMVPAIMGNLLGRFPPQRRSLRAYRAVARAYLRAHAGAYHLIHQVQPLAPDGTPSKVGVAMAYPWIEPWKSPGPAGWYERAAAGIARRAAFEGWDHTIRTGKPHWIHGGPATAGVQNTYDYCGINYYMRVSLKYDRRRCDQYRIDDAQAPPGTAMTQTGWQIYPEGFYQTIRAVWKRFGKPILITENGIADDADEQRPRYIVEHLAQVHRALQEGIPILGYYHWAFLDNFEWREGFAKRFGLIAVRHDDPDLTRAPRRSAYLYSDIAQQNAVTKETVKAYAPQSVAAVFGAGEDLEDSGRLAPERTSR
ncbi:MAG: glycoside hydrolase family 1 protein [Lentisphaerae bacterium]|nr:glycoside hydrolase family 1 protein [Lentisphaerota bacterium]